MMIITPINIAPPRTLSMVYIVYDTSCSFIPREGVSDEIGKEVMEVSDERDGEFCDEIGWEVEVSILQETPATPTCLTMSLPS